MGSKSQSRGTSPMVAARRPKLMRAAATAPSLATSNASRKDLASRQSSRAATLLNRVASYSTAQHEHRLHGTPGSVYSNPEQGSPDSSASMEERKEPFQTAIHQSGNYFSFPSFEDFQDFQENEERLAAMHDKGVP
ncbi:hypothetical protein LSUB1_G000115 [Lachnellula subtilissima]|uniref:Uncharacterized protein n=1 Tax=Lachnellula subtilissima TaxID=602034 RepID=A0A8H8RYZ8_9HELO|nr:hypothetical protein LSUB1_G000115 [Lachnellula subtilissima]